MRGDVLRVVTIFAASLGSAFMSAPLAAPPSFRVQQIASSQDGFGQIIELAEIDGLDGQQGFAGLTLSVTNRFGITKTIVFASDLPTAATANRHVLISTGFGGGFEAGAPRIDYELPQLFLPTDGGTIDFAGVDQWTFDEMPTDGRILFRGGEPGRGTVQNFAGKAVNCCGPVFTDPTAYGIDFTIVTAVEFYNASLDHYFLSASQPDIDALQSGRIPGWAASNGPDGNWVPVASVPAVYTSYGPGGARISHDVPVCRFFIPPGSHFFSASADECSAVAQAHPQFVPETNSAFYMTLPDIATGECPADTGFRGVIGAFTPVYRLWNNRPDTNHRYTISTRVRSEMIAKGWISEGYGPMGVAMCGLDFE